MHFLMPALFASHADFKDWFSNPLNNMVEGEQAVNKVRTPQVAPRPEDAHVPQRHRWQIA